MTLAEVHERAMRAYVRARVLDGWLADGAARDAVDTWGVPPGPERDALVERLSVVNVPNTDDEGSET